MSDFAYPIRPISIDELPASFEMVAESFGNTYPVESELEHDRALFEPERSLSAFDGPLIVGSALGLSFEMALPGGVAPVLGVTAVAVRQTHRRRGILRALMTRQLTDLHDGGREPVAALSASESAIYGRFGYGSATTAATMTLYAHETAFAPGAPSDPALRLRGAAPADAVGDMAKVFDARLGSRPGAFARNDAWWATIVHDPEYSREGLGPLRCVLAEDAAGPRGYALFASRGDDDADEIPAGRLTVHELYAADPAAYAALWDHVLNQDLIRTVTVPLRPADDPVLRLLADPRRARPRLIDGMWARLVDVDRALAARRYSAPVDAVIEVRDDLCPWNAGRWRLRAGAEGAECARTTGAPDVTVPVNALGGAYFGGTRLSSYGEAGLVEEHRQGALHALSTAFSWDPSPWCPTMF
ncbi:MAG TPA: GNAT family N-acetyltransferase [Streptosporangiaceae bacterium]|jgi:predicted acetyltransferase